MYVPTSQELTQDQEFELYIEAQTKEDEAALYQRGYKAKIRGEEPEMMFYSSEAYRRGYGAAYCALIMQEHQSNKFENGFDDELPF